MNQIYNNIKNVSPIFIVLIIITLVVAVGIIVTFGFKSSSQNSIINNGQTSQDSINATNTKNYVEISTDKIGEYISETSFSKDQMLPIEISSLEKINFYNYSFKDKFKTLDFSNSTIKPSNFYDDGVKFDAYTEMFLHWGDLPNYDKSQQISTTQYDSFITDMNLKLYKTDLGYTLFAYNGEFFWKMNANYSDEAEAEEKFKQMLKCITTECDPTAPLAKDFIYENLMHIDFDTISFDFDHNEIQIQATIAYVNLKNSEQYSISSIDNGLTVNYGDDLLTFLVSYRKSNIISIESVKSETARVYDTEINNKKIRIYENSNSEIIYLGIIDNDSEYLLSTGGSTINIDKLVELLQLTIVQ